MTHGSDEYSGMPVRSTVIEGVELEYDVRTDKLTVYKENGNTKYDPPEEFEIPRKGVIQLRGEKVNNWSELEPLLEEKDNG